MAAKSGLKANSAKAASSHLLCRCVNQTQENQVAGELILIIEDNEKNRKLCRDVLQVKGYRTIESETAEEGLDLARNQAPGLILMDIQLPGMDGVTALKQLKSDPSTSDIPIIAITASAMTNNRTAMLAEGFDGYQNKPITLKDFLGEVARVLENVRSQG
jgi:CheY-like chemotaxis protein